VEDKDPVQEQDSKNEDDEFKRIENEQELKKLQSQVNPLPK
jgi:hypothetical protein